MCFPDFVADPFIFDMFSFRDVFFFPSKSIRRREPTLPSASLAGSMKCGLLILDSIVSIVDEIAHTLLARLARLARLLEYHVALRIFNAFIIALERQSCKT